MSLQAVRLSQSDLSENVQYVYEDIYEFPSSSAGKSLPCLVLSSKVLPTQEQYYRLLPLLRALIDNFFGLRVKTISVYIHNDILKMVPRLSQEKAVYSSQAKIDYFKYYVRPERLFDYSYLSLSPALGQKKGVFSLFGVYFTDQESRKEDLRDYVSSLKQRGLFYLFLEDNSLLKKIASDFTLLTEKDHIYRKRQFFKGEFSYTLDKYWLKETWQRLLFGQSAQVPIYYTPRADSQIPEQNNAAHLLLAAHLARPEADEKSLSLFPGGLLVEVNSLQELEKIVSGLLVRAPLFSNWLVVSAPLEELKVRALQLALEEKYPFVTTWALDNLIVADTPVFDQPQFSQEELMAAEEKVLAGILPKQFQER